MSSENTSQKINLILCDLPPGVTQSDIETFLSPYKSSIDSIEINPKNSQKATAAFKDPDIANKCRWEMNQKKLKDRIIRIMREEKHFIEKNKESKNNLYIKNIPKEKDAHQLYEYFLKYGDVFSLKINQNEKGEYIGTAFLTYYKEDDAKKCLDENKDKKILECDIEVQYRKNTNHYIHNNNYHNNYNNNYGNYNNRNLKINITNLPENYNETEISKLCEEFGKFEICDIKTNERNGKFAIVKFSKESDAKTALEKLNNKEVESKKLLVKELNSYNYNNNNYHQNYNYKRSGNYNFIYPNMNMNINNIPLQKYDEPIMNNNLYVANIPPKATKEDLEKTFGEFGEIDSIKLDEDENSSSKKEFINKEFGYVLFKKIEDAKKACESLHGKYIKGFENHYKLLIVEYFIPKDKRNLMANNSYMNLPSPPTPMMYPGTFMPQPYMMPIPMGMTPMQNNQLRPQQYMYSQGNFKSGFGNRKYNNFRGRGRGKNYQKRNNNTNSTNNGGDKVEEKKVEFDHESFNKLKNEEEKKDFLGEKLFNLIQENRLIKEKNEDSDTVGKITGMIIGIPNLDEIIDVLESPSKLEARIKEALELLEKK